MGTFQNSATISQEDFDHQHRFDCWYRDKYLAFESDAAKAIFNPQMIVMVDMDRAIKTTRGPERLFGRCPLRRLRQH
jgi:hypothetical protein